MTRFLMFFFLLSASMFGEEIEIVYHIATMKRWRGIVQEQITMLHNSGLLEACDHLTVTVVGPQIRTVHALFQQSPFYEKVHIIHAGRGLHQYEFPAIDKVKKIALTCPNAKILYMHTQGVSHSQDCFKENVEYWRHYLQHFVITQWKDCVEALESYDLCGVDWIEQPELHFSGNFWWTRADYLRTCQGTAKRHGRWDCEYFIGSGQQPKVKSFHQSGRDLYYFAYLPSYYR